jgi:hypothetical protein
MKHRRLWLLGAAFLVVDGCSVSTSTEGALSNGAFGYVCPNGSDNGCDAVSGDSASLPPVIAVGASFSLAYLPSSSALEPGSPESTTQSILVGTDGNFQFAREGTAGVIVRGAHGDIVDFANLDGEVIAGAGAFEEGNDIGCEQVGPPPPDVDAGPGDGGDGGSDGGVPDAGGGGSGGGGGGVPVPGAPQIVLGQGLNVRFEPVDARGQQLAGSVAVEATSSDDTTVSIGPSIFGSAHGFELCGNALGEVVITVTVNETTTTFPFVVVGQQ